MRFGYNTNGFAHHRLIPMLQILADMGYWSVALTLDNYLLNPFDPDILRQCDKTRAFLNQMQLRCVVETGARFLIDPLRKHQPTLLSAVDWQRENRFDFLRRSIDIAHHLHADAVSFWSGTPIDGASEGECWTRLVDGCRRLCEVAEKVGMRLAFEPEPGMFIDTMERFAELHRRVAHPLFGLTLDVGHLHCQGEVPIADHIHRWRAWLWNVHIEDMRRGVHEHLMFGEGEMDFPPIFRALRDIAYDGGVHVELSRHSHDAVNVATRALAFLKEANVVRA